MIIEQKQELEWFRVNRNRAIPADFVEMIYKANSGNDSELIVMRTLEIMQLMLDAPTEKWPSEIEWKQILPNWFTDATQDWKKEGNGELGNSSLTNNTYKSSWDFSSWLRGMKNRGWRWLGYTLCQEELNVYTFIEDSPVYEGTLEHLLIAAGATDIEIEITPIN